MNLQAGPKPARTVSFLAALAAIAFIPVPQALSAGSGGIGTGEDQPTTGTSGSADGVFPVIGRVQWGDGLGAGRDHQGQDLLAKCGKPVVASYPGRVQVSDTHSAAGNYVVIDGAGKLEDTVYMHLQRPSKLRKRSRVEAGDLIGRVGSTGRSTACHLHFEIWSQPGYYEGGSPLNPKPYLKRWD